ncbi:MAG: hypothetical protein WBP45_05300, partial [Daejeonella sp.]
MLAKQNNQFFFNQQIAVGRSIFTLLFSILLLSSCSNQQEQKKIRIGFSQCQGGDDWRKTMLAEMKRELSFHDNVEFIYRDAEADSKKQLK